MTTRAQSRPVLLDTLRKAARTGDPASRYSALMVEAVNEIEALAAELVEAKAALLGQQRANAMLTDANAVLVKTVAALQPQTEEGFATRLQPIALPTSRAGKVRRKLGRPGAEPEKIDLARRALADGFGVVKVAKTVGLGVGTVHRLKREAEGQAKGQF